MDCLCVAEIGNDRLEKGKCCDDMAKNEHSMAYSIGCDHVFGGGIYYGEYPSFMLK